jgi:hypothetical protein
MVEKSGAYTNEDGDAKMGIATYAGCELHVCVYRCVE